jgi:programmed cell death protein 5
MSGFQLPPGFTPSAPPGGSSNGGASGSGGASQEEQAAAAQKQAAQEEMKRSMIAAMLEPAARERCESYHESFTNRAACKYSGLASIHPGV